MEEIRRYAVGVDIGTSTVRCVVASVDDTGLPTIIGFSENPNSGMRRGTISNLSGPAAAIDNALGEVERMSGYEVNAATISINGAHISSIRTNGMIAVGPANHEITYDDLDRIDAVAAMGKIPANREVLDTIPYDYILDGQGNIKDPVGMVGDRLEVKANIISALTPYCNNLRKVADMAQVEVESLIVAPVAAAKAILTERQLENGVAIVDIGASTTSITIFEDSDLQFVSILPVGSNSITNDLAMGLKTDPEIAESIKLNHVSVSAINDKKDIIIKHDKEILTFKRSDIDEIVDARLDEIFDLVRKEFKKAGYDQKLPEGVIFTGGGANLKGLVDYAKDKLELSAKVGKSKSFAGVGNSIEKPEFATAIGLMIFSSEGSSALQQSSHGHKKRPGPIKKLFSKFKIN